MTTSCGPYPVTTFDPTQRAIVGHLDGVGFYFRVLDGQGDEVDGQGLNGELPHLVSLLEASWIYCDWQAEPALVGVLKACDPALTSTHPGIVRLLSAA